MPSFLQIENISKSYGPKVLFENIGFNVNEGDKIALIAPNGTGKTSLLRILAGKDSSDSGGRIIFLKDIRIAFLEQEYTFDPDATVWQQVLSDSEEWMKDLDQDHVYEYEQRIRKFLTSFGLQDYSKKMKQLSGGEVKRVALVVTLSCEPDFYIMDEPTNHLDLDAVEYLENYLSHSRCTVLMVTHDRYFLDNVAGWILELDRGRGIPWKGNYSSWLEQKEKRLAQEEKADVERRKTLARELEWIHMSPKGRHAKGKARLCG